MKKYSPQKLYESRFKTQIKKCSTHKHYERLKKWAEDCLSFHTISGYYAIKAVYYMNEINNMSKKELFEWLDRWIIE